MTFKKFISVAALAAFALPFAASRSASAETPKTASRITAPVNNAQRATLAGHVRPFLSRAVDNGRVADSEMSGPIMLIFSRTPKQQADLDSLVDQLHNKNSASYHKWLTPTEFGARFEPADSDVAAVKSWLVSQGFTILDIVPSKTHISFKGTMGQLKAAFGVEVHHFSINGESHVATISEPQIPAALAPVIGGINKLDDFGGKPLVHLAGAYKKDGKTGATTRVAGVASAPFAPSFTTPLPPSIGTGTDYNLGPQDFYTIYNENPLLSAGITGAGQTIAVIEEVQVATADVTTFRSQFGLPAYPATPNSTGGGVNYLIGSSSGLGGYASCYAPVTQSKGKSSGEESEADIDLQWAGAVAPNAIVDFVACGGTKTSGDGTTLGALGIDHSAQYIANYLSSTVVAASMSYGECEADMTSSQTSGVGYYNNQWEQFAAEGITPIISSGDGGAEQCYQNGTNATTLPPSINGFGDSAYNVSAGGTDFGDLYETNNYTTSPVSTFWNATNGTGLSSAVGYVPETTWAGYCSNQLFASYLQAEGSTTFGSVYTPSAICSNATAKTDGLLAVVGAAGGISTYNTIPTWQSVYGVGLNSVSTTYRNIPDVSLYASNGWWGHSIPFCESDTYACTYTNSTDAYYLGAGGTSFVAPQLAGLMALVSQKTGQRQGQADYTFYNLAAQQYGTPGNPASGLTGCSGSGVTPGQRPSSSCYFYDVSNDMPSLQGGTITPGIYQPCVAADLDCYKGLGTTYGVNTVPGTTPSAGILGYTASPGYDDATGLGSLNIYGIVEGWNNATPTFASTTTESSSASTVTPSGTVTLTATVVATGRGSTVSPAGSVSFLLGSTSGTSLGTGTITPTCTGTGAATSCKGVATLTINGSVLAAGTNNIYASFPGDGANDGPSTSAAVTVKLAGPPVGNLELAVDAATSQPTVPTTDTLFVSGWVGDPVDGSPVGNVKVYIDGVSYGTPTLGVSRPDVVSYSGNSAYAASGYTFTLAASTLAPGTHAVTVVAIDSAGQTTTFGPLSITVTAVYPPPVGNLEAPAIGTTTSVAINSSVDISGWIADPTDGSPMTNVTVYIDGVSVGKPALGISRPDVVSYTGNSTYANSGFSLAYSVAGLAAGTHSVTVVGTNSHSISTTFGPSSFTVTDAPPVGNLELAVDSVTAQPTVSQSTGTLFVSGWAADYLDNGPAQSVQILIDGTPAGFATLGGSRPDVASYFGKPAWTNSGYSFTVAASGLSTGSHSVTAVVTNTSGLTSTFSTQAITVTP
jgi:hypothetical protein